MLSPTNRTTVFARRTTTTPFDEKCREKRIARRRMTRTTGRNLKVRAGWFSNNKDVEGREESWKRQQEILAKRRKGGRIDEEANKRRAKVSGFMKKTLSKKEMNAIKKQNTKAANALSKEAVKGGIPFPMASFGMPEFDGGERFDLRGPYADEGWVDPKDLEKKKKKKGGLFGGLFGK